MFKGSRSWLLLLKGVLIGGGGAAAGILLSNNFFSIHTVQGPSMRPTLNPDHNSFFNDRILLIKTKDPKVGSVIVLRNPRDEKSLLIKRLTGVSGDFVKIRNEETLIPEGKVWIRSDSGFGYLDSSVLGPVDRSLVLGSASYILWPPFRFGPIR